MWLWYLNTFLFVTEQILCFHSLYIESAKIHVAILRLMNLPWKCFVKNLLGFIRLIIEIPNCSLWPLIYVTSKQHLIRTDFCWSEIFCVYIFHDEYKNCKNNTMSKWMSRWMNGTAPRNWKPTVPLIMSTCQFHVFLNDSSFMDKNLSADLIKVNKPWGVREWRKGESERSFSVFDCLQ